MNELLTELLAIGCSVLAGIICWVITEENCFRKERNDAQRERTSSESSEWSAMQPADKQVNEYFRPRMDA
jgi:hypothetical protein